MNYTCNLNLRFFYDDILHKRTCILTIIAYSTDRHTDAGDYSTFRVVYACASKCHKLFGVVVTASVCEK